MKTIKLTAFFLGCVLLPSCASLSGWTPTVDNYGDPNAYRLSQDMNECQQLASHASGGTAKETAIGAGVGGLIGAAGGEIGRASCRERG